MKPYDVWDRVVTDEGWIIHPVNMILVDTISKDIVDELSIAIRLFHQQTKSKSNLRLRVAQYAIAERVLGSKSPREKRIINHMIDVLKLPKDDLEDYILNHKRVK